MGFDYIPKSGKVYVVSLTTSWAQVLTQAQTRGIRGFMIKSRYTDGGNAPGPYNLAFNASPSSGTDSDGNGYLSFEGSPEAKNFGPANGVWAKSTTDGTIIEIAIYE